jgi:antitoxin VapB
MGYPLSESHAMNKPIGHTVLFKSNRSQAVRLPKDVAFPDSVRNVRVVKEGKGRLVLPADAAWDDFFDAPGIDLPPRDELPVQEREPF